VLLPGVYKGGCCDIKRRKSRVALHVCGSVPGEGITITAFLPHQFPQTTKTGIKKI